MRGLMVFLTSVAMTGAIATAHGAPPSEFGTTNRTVESSAPRFAMLTPRTRADRIVVLKGERKLLLIRDDRVIRSYRIALGRYPRGHKIKEGDSRTPEGTYTVDYRLDTGESRFYRALHISYPNDRDRERARFLGVDPGGQIMIHGLPEDWSARQLDHPSLDWTQGCIAVTNREIDEIWRLVSDGIRIEIQP